MARRVRESSPRNGRQVGCRTPAIAAPAIRDPRRRRRGRGCRMTLTPERWRKFLYLVHDTRTAQRLRARVPLDRACGEIASAHEQLLDDAVREMMCAVAAADVAAREVAAMVARDAQSAATRGSPV